jgi:hypothetical protein
MGKNAANPEGMSGGLNLLVAGYLSSYRLRRFFGGLHGADIDEILGMNLVAVWQRGARGQARFR